MGRKRAWEEGWATAMEEEVMKRRNKKKNKSGPVSDLYVRESDLRAGVTNLRLKF